MRDSIRPNCYQRVGTRVCAYRLILWWDVFHSEGGGWFQTRRETTHSCQYCKPTVETVFFFLVSVLFSDRIVFSLPLACVYYVIVRLIHYIVISSFILNLKKKNKSDISKLHFSVVHALPLSIIQRVKQASKKKTKKKKQIAPQFTPKKKIVIFYSHIVPINLYDYFLCGTQKVFWRTFQMFFVHTMQINGVQKNIRHQWVSLFGKKQTEKLMFYIHFWVNYPVKCSFTRFFITIQERSWTSRQGDIASGHADFFMLLFSVCLCHAYRLLPDALAWLATQGPSSSISTVIDTLAWRATQQYLWPR